MYVSIDMENVILTLLGSCSLSHPLLWSLTLALYHSRSLTLSLSLSQSVILFNSLIRLRLFEDQVEGNMVEVQWVEISCQKSSFHATLVSLHLIIITNDLLRRIPLCWH